MQQLDRLSALVQNFEVLCRREGKPSDSNLWISSKNDTLSALYFAPGGEICPSNLSKDETLRAWITLEIGSRINPLIHALPEQVQIKLDSNQNISTICDLIVREHESPRCGVESVFARLGELLIIHMMRNSIELNETRPGVLAGLAHPKIQKVIVAIHDKPQQQWKLEDFTNLAGMSRSRFMEEFQTIMAETPMAYLKRWRLSLAETALREGARLSEIARRFGFRGTEAFSRAFSQHYGMPPSQFRKSHAVENATRSAL